jgi:hypothetical protein
MDDEKVLRVKAREAMGAGKLPVRRPERTWGGKGGGACCAVCDLPVRRDEIGFDLEFLGQSVDSNGGNYALHIRCLAAWEFERGGLALASKPDHLQGRSTDGTITGRELDPTSGGRPP